MHKVVDSNDIVITRYNKPVSVAIDYEDYLAIFEQLEDPTVRRAAATLEPVEQDAIASANA